MKKTSEELLEWLGLKLGDVIQINGGHNIYIIRKYETLVYQNNKSGYCGRITELLDNTYTILRKPKLSDAERVILENLPKEYNWIARDGIDDECSGEVSCFNKKPFRSKMNKYWLDRSNVMTSNYPHLFQFIKWEDEPYEIKELLNER